MNETDHWQRMAGIKRFSWVLLGVLLLQFQFGCTTEPERDETEAAVSEKKEAKRQTLLGQWLRQDGGYMLEIKRVRSSGQLEAAYYNPKPINVKTAEVRQEGKEIRIYVELSDVGYPGSYYDLLYEPDQDVLTGNYFQATQKANYPVFFVRNPAR